MKRASFYFNLSAAILTFVCGTCYAQTIYLKQAPLNTVIDGDAQEWGAKLPYFNDKAKISYLLANDKDYIYLVIKTNDTVKQSDILGSGITLSINTKGNKIAPNTTQIITFPERGKEDPSEYLEIDSEQTHLKVILTKYRKVKIAGFPAINEDELSTANPYGIEIAMGYNDAGYLTYEEAIPLSLFDARAFTGNEWAINIQINGLERAIRNPMFYAGGKIRSDTAGDDANNNNGDGKQNTAPIHDNGAPLTGADIRRGTIRLTLPVDFWLSVVLAKMP